MANQKKDGKRRNPGAGGAAMRRVVETGGEEGIQEARGKDLGDFRSMALDTFAELRLIRSRSNFSRLAWPDKNMTRHHQTRFISERMTESFYGRNPALRLSADFDDDKMT